MHYSAAALVTFLTIAPPLYAQGIGRYGISGDEGRFYAGAALVAERMPELPGEGLTWSLAGGADFTERLGLRVVFEPAREAPGFEDVFMQPSLPLPTRVTYRETRSIHTWAVLGDRRWRLGSRMRLAVTYGVAIVTTRSKVIREVEVIQPDGTLLP